MQLMASILLRFPSYQRVVHRNERSPVRSAGHNWILDPFYFFKQTMQAKCTNSQEIKTTGKINEVLESALNYQHGGCN